MAHRLFEYPATVDVPNGKDQWNPDRLLEHNVLYHELLVADHVPVVARVGDDAAVEEVVFVERVQNLSDVRVDKRNESEIP